MARNPARNKERRRNMRQITKLERKFGKYAIPNLIRYVMVLYLAGVLIGTIAPEFYSSWLVLDINKVLHGQVWRLFTFLMEPNVISGGGSIFYIALKLYLYWMIGNSLENAWGKFRFNLYIFGGYLFSILGMFIVYFLFGISRSGIGMDYIYQTMFFAFAATYPNVQFLLFFIIPVKVKWLAILDGIMIGWDMFEYIKAAVTIDLAYLYFPILVAMAMANFLIFFFTSRGLSPQGFAQRKRKREYQKKVERPMHVVHRCAVCGRTPEDNPQLEFRYCSKCRGNFEYCNDHIFTHTHVE